MKGDLTYREWVEWMKMTPTKEVTQVLREARGLLSPEDRVALDEGVDAVDEATALRPRSGVSARKLNDIEDLIIAHVNRWYAKAIRAHQKKQAKS